MATININRQYIKLSVHYVERGIGLNYLWGTLCTVITGD
jgi:uncharacterized protein (DUF486 family)